MVKETEVRFAGNGGVMLAGTLTVPEGKGPFPGVVLVVGSGPTDRDGNQRAGGLVTDLLKQVAEALATGNIASLRYDKRAIGQSDKPGSAADVPDFSRLDRFVGDVESAAAFLRTQAGIDARRIGLGGHSEGGLLVLEAAPRVKPSALLLMGTAGRPLSVVIHEQLVSLLIAQKATPEQTRYFLSEDDRISKAVVQTEKVPADVPPGLAALYPAYLGSFLQKLLSADPVRDARLVRCPTLIVQGEKDVQISAVRDAPVLNRALTVPHELYVVPGASHNLKRSADTVSGPVAPDALKKIAEWTAKVLNS